MSGHPFGDQTLDLLAARARISADALALREDETGRSVTYAQLDQLARQMALLLHAMNIHAGARVAILCRNRIEFFALLFACARLGAILVPLNWRAPVPELQVLLEDCTPGLLIYGKEDAHTAAALQAAGGPAFLGLDETGPEGLPARLSRTDPTSARAEDILRQSWPLHDPWVLIYTSGTTGKPKAVIQTCAMALVNYINISQACDLTSADTGLNFLPLFHTAGINLHTLPLLLLGAQVSVLSGFDAGRVLTLMAAGRLSTFFGVPAVYQALADHPDFARTDLSGVRHWGCGGAPLSDQLLATFGARNVIVCNGFGMTETGPTLFIARPHEARAAIGTVGRAQLMSQARICRPDGSACGPQETGEIWVRGPGITPGYWNQPEATRAAFTPDGWLRTGDLARADADGCVFIVGRIKEMYISGGENVYPAEIENLLASHPDVVEAAVIGVSDARWGEVGHAYVIARRPGALDPGALEAFCRAHLAAFKVPRRFIQMEDFPRTAAGKVRKHLLGKHP